MPPGGYLRPPIREAICELRFASSRPWDLTVAFDLLRHLRETYSGTPRQVLSGHTGIDPASGQALGQVLPRLQFLTPDERQILAVGENLISVSVLAPYPGWLEFRQQTLAAFQAYTEVAAPVGVTRIGIRYINQIRLPGEKVDLDAFFHTAPTTPPGMPQLLGPFLVRFLGSFTDPPEETLTFTLANVADETGQHVEFLMDLDVAQEWEAPFLELSEVEARLERLRTREREAFEAAITDRLREVFDAVN